MKSIFQDLDLQASLVTFLKSHINKEITIVPYESVVEQMHDLPFKQLTVSADYTLEDFLQFLDGYVFGVTLTWSVKPSVQVTFTDNSIVISVTRPSLQSINPHAHMLST